MNATTPDISNLTPNFTSLVRDFERLALQDHPPPASIMEILNDLGTMKKFLRSEADRHQYQLMHSRDRGLSSALKHSFEQHLIWLQSLEAMEIVLQSVDAREK